MTDFDVKTTCCFSGHRELDNNFFIDNTEETIKKLIKEGYKTFLVGMALGFDTVVFQTLLKYKNNNIDIIACVPCPEQNKYFTKEQQQTYLELLNKADKIVYTSNVYSKGCMFKRNRYMVDNSSLLVAYLKENKGGTYYTVKYALSLNKKLVLV